MKLKDVETQEDMIEYYECLIDYLYDHVPCMDELIALYDEGLEDDE
jgi:hypothetical protein